MKVTILALGALVTTASAGWILPEQRQDRDPHRHYQPAPPHSSHPPSKAEHAAHAAMSSPRQPCHGNAYHGGRIDNHPQSGLGVMMNSLRTWLNEHNILRYHPTTYRPHHPLDGYTVELENGLTMTSSGPTQMIDWDKPVFIDDDPEHPLSSPETLQKVLGMIDEPSAKTGYLVRMKSGTVTVVRIGDEGNNKTVYKPGSGLKPEEMGLQDRRGDLVPIFRPDIKWKPQSQPELRLTQLAYQDVTFTDDDPDHPLSNDEMRMKIEDLLRDESLHGSMPTLKTGHISALMTGNGGDQIRKYRPIGSAEPDKVSDQAETDRMAIQGMKNWAKEKNGGVETDVIMASTFGESRTIYNVDPGMIEAIRKNPGRQGVDKETALAGSNGQPRFLDSRPPPPGSGQLYKSVDDMSVEILWRDAVFVGENLQTVLSDAEVNDQIWEMIEEAGRMGGYLPRMKSGLVRVQFMAPRSTNTQVYRPGYGRQSGQVAEVEIGSSGQPWGPGGEGIIRIRPRPMRIFAGHGDERPGGGLHGKGGWHHRRPQTFGGRAMRNLRPSESLALAFVLGAGMGSILNMLFMITLLLTRRLRCRRSSKEEREQLRVEREGRVRLEGSDEAICILRNPIRDDEGRVPPEYEAAAAVSAAKV